MDFRQQLFVFSNVIKIFIPNTFLGVCVKISGKFETIMVTIKFKRYVLLVIEIADA